MKKQIPARKSKKTRPRDRYGSGTGEKPPTAERFLFPLRFPIVRFAEANALVARIARHVAQPFRLPAALIEGDILMGTASLGRIDDLTATLPANLRVSFVLQEMRNTVVSGPGVDEIPWATWFLTSTAATQELYDAAVGLPAPGPGEAWPVPHANLIYDGLVVDGCGNTPVFPVTLVSAIQEAEDTGDLLPGPFEELEVYEATDNSTLTPNGFWSFNYTIRAEGMNSGVSDFGFKGIVLVTCTTLTGF